MHSKIYNNHEHFVISSGKSLSFNGNLAHAQQISQLLEISIFLKEITFPNQEKIGFFNF
jgi:hypothetical protein